jgi:hypothetical protein
MSKTGLYGQINNDNIILMVYLSRKDGVNFRAGLAGKET